MGASECFKWVSLCSHALFPPFVHLYRVTRGLQLCPPFTFTSFFVPFPLGAFLYMPVMLSSLLDPAAYLVFLLPLPCYGALVKREEGDSKEEVPGSNPCGRGGDKDALCRWEPMGGSFLNARGRTTSVDLSLFY